MRKIFLILMSIFVCFGLVACGNPDSNDTQTEKLQDFAAITMDIAQTKTITLTDYILPKNSELEFSAVSDNTGAVSAEIDGDTLTLQALSAGTANITVSIDTVSETFAVTVNETQQPPVNVSAPKFSAESIDIDLFTNIEKTDTLTFAPTLNSDNALIVYGLKESLTGATLSGNTLTYIATETGNYKLTIQADYYGSTDTEKTNKLGTVEFDVTINVTDTTPAAPVFSDKTLTVDRYEESATLSIKADSNPSKVIFTYTTTDTITGLLIDIDVSKVTVTVLNEFVGDSAEINIVATYNKTLTVNFKIAVTVIDTTEYRVLNGDFETGDLTGWTKSWTQDADKIGGVSSADTWWAEGYPFNKAGNYLFSGYDGDFKEANTGTLTSSSFKVGGSGYITYLLGGAAASGQYLTVIDAQTSEVLGIYRNTKFNSVDPADIDADEIGETIFMGNMALYKVDLSSFIGQSVKVQLNDTAGTGNWNLIFFDDLKTYYLNEPTNGTLAENELATKTELKTLIDGKITAQGDYTTESYDEYISKFDAAKSIYDDISVLQSAVDNAVSQLNTAITALEYRVPTSTYNPAETKITIGKGKKKTIDLANYFDTKQLSNLTFTVTSSNTAALTVGTPTGLSIELTALDVTEDTTETLTIVFKHYSAEVLTATLSVDIISDKAPEVNQSNVTYDVDIYYLENKTEYAVALSDNITNLSSLVLSYQVAIGDGTASDSNSSYNYALSGTYNDVPQVVVLNVTVSYTLAGTAGSKTFTVTLNITNSTTYRLANGGFENGITGWTVTGGDIGDISTESNYWLTENGGYSFNKDGEKFFSAYVYGASGTEAVENAVGYLTSSNFVIGGSGFITFKIGGAKQSDKVYIDVIEAETGNILGRYGNDLWSETTNNIKSGCTMIAYKANLFAHKGKTAYIRVTDNGVREYGLFFVDSFVTYYASEPSSEDFNALTAVTSAPTTIYEILNGGFEKGDLSGWRMTGEIGSVTNESTYWGSISYNKTGEYLFSGDGFESKIGSLSSNIFKIGGSGYISFKIGGMKGNDMRLEVIELETGKILTAFTNFKGTWTHPTDGWTLIGYYADLSALIGSNVYIRLVDGKSKDYGVIIADEIVTYYNTAPNFETELIGYYEVRAENKATAPATIYEIKNGGFESGNLDGWEMNSGYWQDDNWVETSIGEVTNATEYAGGYHAGDDTTYPKASYNKTGEYFFSGGIEGSDYENKTGSLRSSVFEIGGIGYISFKIGGMKGNNLRLEIVEAATGNILTKFTNTDGEWKWPKNGWTLMEYKADLSNFIGASVYIRLEDNATNDYGVIVADEIITYYVNAQDVPDYNLATPL